MKSQQNRIELVTRPDREQWVAGGQPASTDCQPRRKTETQSFSPTREVVVTLQQVKEHFEERANTDFLTMVHLCLTENYCYQRSRQQQQQHEFERMLSSQRRAQQRQQRSVFEMSALPPPVTLTPSVTPGQV